MKEIMIAIPAYNEEKTVGATINACSPYGQVVVINDGSTDKTKFVAIENGAIIIDLKVNKGYSNAINEGIEYAKTTLHEIIIFVDADGQHPTTELLKFANKLRGGKDIVIGARSTIVRLSERVIANLSRNLFNIYDPLCGMKGYKISFLRNCPEYLHNDSMGTSFCLYGAIKRIKISNLDIQCEARKFGNSRISRNKIAAEIKIISSFFTTLFMLIIREKIIKKSA